MDLSGTNRLGEADVDADRRRPAGWSVRTLLLWLLLACLLPGMFGAGLLIVHQYREGRAQLENNTVQTARALMQAVDNQIFQAAALAHGLATAGSLAHGDLAAFHVQARETLDRATVARAAILVDRDGRQVLNTLKAFGEPLPRTGNPELVARVFERGEPIVSDLYWGAVTQSLVMTVGVPVIVDGRVDYVLIIPIRSASFAAILDAQDMPAAWTATVLDSAGTIAARNGGEEGLVGRKLAPESLEHYQASAAGTAEVFVQDSDPVLSVFVRSPATGWGVKIGISWETLQASLTNRLLFLGGSVIGLFALGAVLAWMVGGKITRSFRALMVPAFELGGGRSFSPPSVEVREAADLSRAMSDAAELLKAHRAVLLASEEKYRTLFSNMTEGFALGEPVFDAQGRPADFRFIEVNDAFYRQSGIPSGMLGRPAREFLPDIEQSWIDRYVGVALTGKAERFESYNADTRRHFDVYAFSPTPGRFAIVFRDITRRRAEQEALRLAEARYRRLCDANLVGILVADGEGKVVEANDHYLNLIGYTRDDLAAGRIDWRAITPPEWLPADEKALAELAQTGVCTPYEKEYQLPDGSRRSVYIFDALLPGETGLILGLILDITERRRVEKTVARLNENLEQQVQERTAQLVRAQKMEAMGRLTGGVAHDFNNILQGLANCMFVLERFVPAGDPRTVFEAAKRSVQTGARLTKSMLAFAGRQTLAPEAVDPARLFESLRPLLERTLGGLIRVRFQVQPGVPPALADRGQLESALLNLAINARDAMPGGGLLTLRAAAVRIRPGEDADPPELAPGDYVALGVEDEGVGMDEATLARVFEPFFTTKGLRGTGLGLSMVHGMATQSGGTVAIASAPGRGTTVTLYLPAAPAAATEPALPAPAACPGNGATVLVVDDSEAVRISLSAALEALGYRVLVANGAEAALRLLAARPVDALVTDYAMPGMTGAELARHVHSTRPDLPVLLVTGYADRRESMEGITVLQKPFQPQELAACLAGLLAEKGGK